MNTCSAACSPAPAVAGRGTGPEMDPSLRQPWHIGAGLCLWLLIASQLAPVPASAQVRAGDMVGSRPALVVETLDGGVFDLSRQRGQWLVINFWATWCAPCIKEIPELSALADREDVVVLGLNYEEIGRAELDAFVAEHQPRYAIAPVDPWQPLEAFPVPRAMPVTYLLDPAGTVVQAWLGPVDQALIERAMVPATQAVADDD